MESRLPFVIVVLALLAAACSGSTAAPTTNPDAAVTTTSSVSPSTAAPSTTTAAPSTTAAETTSSTSSSTTTTTTTMPLADLVLALEEVASGFEQPVFLTAPPGDGRLFVVDQPGRIWVIDEADPAIFLDINGDVVFGGERGLLGMAFHPQFESNGLFYVNYTDNGGDTRVVEFAVSGDPNIADPESARTLIEISQPASNHNGGMIAFGPDDMLYVGMGDGGRSNDYYGQGQRPDTLLGSMLRIDPNTSGLDDADGLEYAIPADNPYVDEGAEGHPAVWAYGLRNPWRFSFDFQTNLMYIGDVGQGQIEEINAVNIAGVVSRGLAPNFGWPILEGSECFAEANCSSDGLTMPIYEYVHKNQGCSVTGGYVYRGSAMPELQGAYFFSDFCGGWIRSLFYAEDGPVEVIDWTPQTGTVPKVASFGVDGVGELYVVSTDGVVYRLVRA